MSGKEYDRIMIATDGSESADMALHSGLKLARALNTKVDIVCVVPTHPAASMPIGSRMMEWEAPFDIMRDEGKKVLTEAANMAKAKGMDVETTLLEGNPADEITGFASANKVDMIVMGTIGRTGLTRFLLGSVAENVVRHSPVEVLVVR